MSISANQSLSDSGFVAREGESELLSELLRQHFCGPFERLLLLLFDADWRLLAVEEVADGQHRQVALQPLALRRLLAHPRGKGLLIAHNHPSTVHNPSRADVALTRQLVDVARMVDLAIVDHMIFTEEGHFSFRAAGLL